MMRSAKKLIASPVVIDVSLWDRRHHEFQRLRALRDAEAAFGALARAEETNRAERESVAKLYGTRPNASKSPEGSAAFNAAFAAISKAEQTFDREFATPLDQAAQLLVLTPAPDLAAITVKIGVIAAFELDNDSAMPREPIDIIKEDAARLAGGPATIIAPASSEVAIDQALAHLAYAEGLAETVAELLTPASEPRHKRALTFIYLLQDELGRAQRALGER